MDQATPAPALQASPLPETVPRHSDSEICSPPPESVEKTTPAAPSSKSVAKRRTPARDAVAGAFSGAFAKTVVAPIERIKLLMQLRFFIDRSSKKNVCTYASATSSAGSSKYSAWDVATTVYREQGFLAFWRGRLYLLVECISRSHSCLILLSNFM